jgi:hypothetical protein
MGLSGNFDWWVVRWVFFFDGFEELYPFKSTLTQQNERKCEGEKQLRGKKQWYLAGTSKPSTKKILLDSLKLTIPNYW